VGRFCLNCGHRIGEPAPVEPAPVEPVVQPAAVEPATRAHPAPEAFATEAPDEPIGLPVQAADPTPIPPVTPEPDWDPHEELLPYEEVDDPEGDAPIKGRAWIAWVLGAVLLVGLVFVLLEAFASDSDPATDPGATDPAASGSAAAGDDRGTEGAGDTGGDAKGPEGVGKRKQLATGATFTVPDTAPPTTDLDGNLVAYEASQLHDGDPRTAWRMAGDASGQTISITLAEPAVVQRIGLVNGYSKVVAGVDWYPNNRRILAVTWTFEDGSTLEQTFTERPRMQMIAVPSVQTGTVALAITSVTPPGSGNLGRDYTAISEVSIIGRRAG
jgi:hypothetical protein